ncbi:unnamed protein product [Coffea canephora]|uniref:Uncharacterized protein n=1 Tax=Coffea canephora TaxID=49390 RepID=A0A068TUL4_COFCA|nr:unnamed protein product [Coffea canephora]
MCILYGLSCFGARQQFGLILGKRNLWKKRVHLCSSLCEICPAYLFFTWLKRESWRLYCGIKSSLIHMAGLEPVKLILVVIEVPFSSAPRYLHHSPLYLFPG